jgi:hypothetical protein
LYSSPSIIRIMKSRKMCGACSTIGEEEEKEEEEEEELI